MTFYLKGTDVADLDISRTIFLKYKSTAMDNEYIVGSDGVDSKRGWALLIIDNKLTFRNYHTPSAYNELESSTNIRDNMWHSIALTCNPTSNVYTLYIDGSSDETGTFTEEHLVGNRVSVGLKYWRGSKYGLNSNSIIDSVRVFTVTKSSTEISNLHSYRPASNEAPITELKQNNLISEITFDSSHTSQIPVLPIRDIELAESTGGIPIYTVQDIPIIKTPSELQLDIAKINIDNVAVLNFDIEKIDFNDLGITNIDLSAIDEIVFPDIDIEIPNIELSTIPEIEHVEADDSDIDIEQPDVYIPPDTKDIPVTDTSGPVKPTTPSTKVDVDDRLLAVDRGSVNKNFNSAFGVKDGVVISFWLKRKVGRTGNVGFTGNGTIFFDYKLNQHDSRIKDIWADTELPTSTFSNPIRYIITSRIDNFHRQFLGNNLKNPAIFNIISSGGGITINYYGIAMVDVPYIRIKRHVVGTRSNGETSQNTYKFWHGGIFYTKLPLFVRQTSSVSLGSNDFTHFAIYLGRNGLQVLVDGDRNNITQNYNNNNVGLNFKQQGNRSLLTNGITEVGGTLVPFTYNPNAHDTKTDRVTDNILNSSGISVPIYKDIPRSVYPRPDLIRINYKRQWVRNKGYVVSTSERTLYSGVKSASGTILRTASEINNEFGMFVWKSGINFIPPDKIKLSLGSSGSTLMDDVRFYDGSAWSSQLVRDLLNG